MYVNIRILAVYVYMSGLFQYTCTYARCSSNM